MKPIKVLAQQQVQLLVLLVLQLLQHQPQVLPILMAVKKVINS